LETVPKIMSGWANSDAIWQDSMFKRAGDDQVDIMFSGFPGDECISNNGAMFFTEYFYRWQWKALMKMLVSEPVRFVKNCIHFTRWSFLGTYLPGFKKSLRKRTLLNKEYIFKTNG